MRNFISELPRVLINCGNLHVGGGVAVATSLIDCLSRIDHQGLEIHLLLSSSVHANIQSLNTKISSFKSANVRDFYGIKALWQGYDNYFKGYDVVFSVFGPVYFAHKRGKHIFGFAQPLIIYPINPVSIKMPLHARISQRVKYAIQELFFSRSDELIVELEHVKRELEKRRLFKNKDIHIVYSAVDSVFRSPKRWAPLSITQNRENISLGLVSRNYPHKNLSCLPFLKKALKNRGLNCDFYVTFTDLEWGACSSEFKTSIVNVGPLSLAQCPSFYHMMDGVIFPSLLECFSAVPIETMVMKKPLFASFLPFIKDCCSEHANYLDPLSVESMAKTIADYFSLPGEVRSEKLAQAYQFVSTYPTPEERAASYLKVIQKALSL